MKWPVLVVALALILPLAGWLRRNPGFVPKIWMIVGFLPFGIGAFHLYMAAISWPEWPGYVSGAEISLLDMLALALYLSLPRKGRTLPFRLSMAMYFVAVLLSAFHASVPVAAFFYAWQLARMFLVYAAVSQACADERIIPAVLTGMAIGLCYEACDAGWQRFGMGILQAGGSFHQNLLGLMSHFVVFPWFALLLAGERGWRPVAGTLTGLVVEVLTISRATIGLAGAGYLGLFALSALTRWTGRKSLVLSASVAVLVLLVPLILLSFEQRFSGPVDTDYDERAVFEKAASLMISEHPEGVGANHYVVAANMDGYNTRAGVAAVVSSEGTNVHNIYYLVTAESGYFGLVTFLLMLLQPLFVAFRCGWRNRGERRGDLLLGLGVSLLIVYLHSFYEWIFITFSPQYLFALDAGLVAGIATNLGYWHRSQSGYRVAVGTPIVKVAKQ